MELLFSCPNCKQQLEADSSMSGSEINCPACGVTLSIPEADPAILKTSPPRDQAAATDAHPSVHFSVPLRDTPAAPLIQKANKPLDVAARDGKTIRIRCIRRTECVEVGKDHFEETVSDFLTKVGEANIINVSQINYSHVDMGTRQILTDYGVMIIYKY